MDCKLVDAVLVISFAMQSATTFRGGSEVKAADGDGSALLLGTPLIELYSA